MVDSSLQSLDWNGMVESPIQHKRSHFYLMHMLLDNVIIYIASYSDQHTNKKVVVGTIIVVCFYGYNYIIASFDLPCVVKLIVLSSTWVSTVSYSEQS